MLIPKPHSVLKRKNLISLMVLDILRTYTDDEHRLTKVALCDKIEEVYGFAPSRTTVYDKLNALTDAGFPIEQDRKDGIYYRRDNTDGVLRFLLDSVLYSDFVTTGGVSEIIEMLEPLASLNFQKYIRSQETLTDKIRRNQDQSVFLTIEDVQNAIFDKRQISCNYLTYHADQHTECVYPEDITVNPYDLIFKNGKYYLLGSLDGSDKMLSWRVDRLCQVKVLDTPCREIPMLKEITASGGMGAYAEKQPELCGGTVETFKIQCAKSAIDDVVDAFGMDFQIDIEQKDNLDDDTVILRVRTTRESMKAWAFMHAGSIVVLSPEDFRKEIMESLSEARRLYQVAGKPPMLRIMTAKDFAEAIRFTRNSARKRLIYHGKGLRRDPERIDLSELQQMPDLTVLSISHCVLEHPEQLAQLPMLRCLHLYECQLPESFHLELPELRELDTTDENLAYDVCRTGHLEKLALFGSKIRDTSMFCDLPPIDDLELARCKNLTDCSALRTAEGIRTLRILDCNALTDYSFLDDMKHLKKLIIMNSP